MHSGFWSAQIADGLAFISLKEMVSRCAGVAGYIYAPGTPLQWHGCVVKTSRAPSIHICSSCSDKIAMPAGMWDDTRKRRHPTPSQIHSLHVFATTIDHRDPEFIYLLASSAASNLHGQSTGSVTSSVAGFLWAVRAGLSGGVWPTSLTVRRQCRDIVPESQGLSATVPFRFVCR